MKKIILLFTFSISTFAGNFIPKDMVGNCEQKTVYTSSQGSDYVSVPVGYNCQYYVWVEETVAQSDVQECSDEDDCQEKLEALTCSDSSYKAIKVTDTDPMQVYCYKTIAAHVEIDETLKAAFDAQVAAKEAIASAIAEGKIKKQKCENALAYILSINDSTADGNAAADAMKVQFADIYEALNDGEAVLAKSLLEQVTDENYTALAAVLISILE